ncbi:hypothetical protein GIB67_005886 [Kingdonia uniflora]|uniref:Uncharacterized protein n=1 Tax=Kingdonia uniflora TaxID=39325 RepID=A0A7J7MBM4_9MAGN|nr:hypothetical protein GIB67_005886 [Kingdonia uniflora]
MRKRKCERRNQFVEVLDQIQKLSREISATIQYNPSQAAIDEADLSLKKLEELTRHLQALQKYKSDRLNQMLDHLNTLNTLCLVLGMNFKQTISEVHPTLDDSDGPKNLSDDTIGSLAAAIQKHREVKIQRMQLLQDLATTMLELWNLMDTPIEEQQIFQNVMCNIAASEHEITYPNTLSVDFIDYVRLLEALKASKMKELVLKKRSELEEICRRTHMVAETDSAMEYAIEAIDSGAVDPSCILEQIELQVSKIREEAFSRKEILERIGKWLSACDEESWLEEYNKDENRYNAGKGAHLTLKRAEKACVAVNKLPALVDALALKARAWEKERRVEFMYDGDQKKFQGQLIAEQEALFGSKPSPSKPQSAKKLPRASTGGATRTNKRLSLGGAMLQTPKLDCLNSGKPTPRPIQKGERLLPEEDSFAALSAGRRGLDITVSSKANNTANLLEDLNKPVNPNLQKTIQVYDTPLTIHSKASAYLEEENWTPKTFPIPVPVTPSTISVPMQTAVTPGFPLACSLQFGANRAEGTPEEIEYSIEERRTGFVLQV